MQKHGHSFASGLGAGLVAAAIATIANPATLAAADSCLAKPDLRANQGGHWYYRYDRVNHRRCWYQASQSETRSAAPASTTAAENPPSQSGLASVFSSMFGGTGAAGVAQDGAGRDARPVRATAETSVKQRSRAAPRVDSDPNTKRVQPRDEVDTRNTADVREALDAVDPRDANVKRVETITIRNPPAAAPAASAAEPAVAQAPPPPPQWSQASESAPPLDAAKREVLFQEFLRWQERRSKPFW
jgi:hypothetical protein